MLEESLRLFSFNDCQYEFENLKYMAMTGLYFYKNYIKCNFCNFYQNVYNCKDPLVEHFKWKICCPLLSRKKCNNKAINNIFTEEFLSHIPVYKNFYSTKFSKISNRLKSFKNKNWKLTNKTIEFATNGFYYSGNDDLIICFYCGIGFYKFLDNVRFDISKEHAKKNCIFINYIKGIDYVYRILNTKILLNKSTQTTFLYDDCDKCDDTIFNKSCKICYEKEANILNIPCSHIVSCETCILNLEYCPICRKNIEFINKVYFS